VIATIKPHGTYLNHVQEGYFPLTAAAAPYAHFNNLLTQLTASCPTALCKLC
jgi:hypothetical protein